MKTDLELQKDVMEELHWHSALKSSNIGVAVDKGIVTLSGSVANYVQKRDAENIVLGVEGVKAVADNLEITLHPSNVRSDTEIARAAVATIHWHSLVPKEQIRLRVTDGWITAEGEVDWLFEKNAVTNSLANLPGVKGVTNEVTIRPRVENTQIKKEIKAAFERNALIDANHVHVEHEGDTVILTGTVRSYAERIEAGNAAAHAPGVAKVDNRLEVKILTTTS
jgi:osmotically-inducible protein OsmY